jgi:hypothetical protein
VVSELFAKGRYGVCAWQTWCLQNLRKTNGFINRFLQQIEGRFLEVVEISRNFAALKEWR